MNSPETRPWIQIRGLYGGVPTELFERGRTLEEYGINAVWIGSGSLTSEGIEQLREQRARVFAEFNSMHEARYLKEDPEAAPVGPDGEVCPPPDGWQGICPTHPGYRRNRMQAFRAALRRFPVDGIWLDYHHSHAAWEQAEPNLPDTCFCPRCRAQFQADTGTPLPQRPVPELSRRLLTDPELHPRWIQWRCDLFTDWVRKFRAILEETRPAALLGTFHCPWSDTDFDGALRDRLAIDLKSQSAYLDVLSPMPYHARFAHPHDPAWIARQTAWLAGYLGLRGARAETTADEGRQTADPSASSAVLRPPSAGQTAIRNPQSAIDIWPIVQLSDWGEPVPVEQVSAVLDYGTRPPATGVMVFAWGGLRQQPEKVEAMGRFYREIEREA
jgi:hypothetical protein